MDVLYLKWYKYKQEFITVQLRSIVAKLTFDLREIVSLLMTLHNYHLRASLMVHETPL